MQRSSAIPHFCALVMIATASPLVGQTHTDGTAIDLAVLPLPASLRGDATVLGQGPDGRFVELRRGRNGLVCEAPPEDEEGLRLFCYQESMRPLRERRQELLAQGRPAEKITGLLGAAVQRGDLPAPHAATSYLLRGPTGCWDAASRKLCAEGSLVYMIYTPMMTTATLGLPLEREGDAPYMHAEGTVWAHIMVEAPAGPRPAGYPWRPGEHGDKASE